MNTFATKARAFVAAAIACAALSGQEPDIATRDLFERFLTAPDAEAAALADLLADLPEPTLARLAAPLESDYGVCKIVRAAGFDPPLAGVVLTPRSKPPPDGFPVFVVVVGPFAGPEEFRLRARFGALLEAGCAIVAPVEKAVWLSKPLDVAETAPRRSERLAPLLAAAGRVAPLDASRRTLLVGRPAGILSFESVPPIAHAFAALHFVLPGDAAPPPADDVASFGPRRVVLHHGPRLSDPSEIRMRRLAAVGPSRGLDVVRVVDLQLEHEPSAVFDAPFAAVAARELAPNRAPAAATGIANESGRSGGAGVSFGMSGATGVVSIDGFGTARAAVLIDEAPTDAVFDLVLPLSGERLDWTSAASWRPRPAPSIEVEGRGGARVEALGPPSKRERLFAWRLSTTSGIAFEDALRIRVRGGP